jgi:hypothetical protein
MGSITSRRIAPWPTSPDRRQEPDRGDRRAPFEDRFRGPRWGGFWPQEFASEFDLQYAEPSDHPQSVESRREDHAAHVERKTGPFLVCTDDRRIVRTFDERWRAVGLLNRFPLAAFVLQAGIVVARRESARVTIGQRVTPAVDMIDVDESERAHKRARARKDGGR